MVARVLRNGARPTPIGPSEAASARTAVSLFSSGGVGELGLKAAGFRILLANELVPYRASLYAANFPETRVLQGDVWSMKDQIVQDSLELLDGDELFLLYATPPCQGMSSNGAGKLRAEIEAGRRGVEDPRNRLIVPTLAIARKLKPRFLLLENVPQMLHTVIRNERDQAERIIDFVQRRLGAGYEGAAEVVASEDFGVPQRRKRLISIFTRDAEAKAFLRRNGGSFITPAMLEVPPTLRDAIGHLPPLDARDGFNEDPALHPQHRVPIMDPRKHWWVSNTREGDTAFNNQCVNPDCLSTETPGHVERKIAGKWTALDTAIHCVDCGHLLPRPAVMEKDGSLRPLRGFHSAYRRMRWDQTARTITQNFIYEASDNKIHPDQNRVLSVYEAMILQSISDYEYRFDLEDGDIGMPRIAEIIGESVPPRLMQILGEHIACIVGRSVAQRTA